MNCVWCNTDREVVELLLVIDPNSSMPNHRNRLPACPAHREFVEQRLYDIAYEEGFDQDVTRVIAADAA